MIGHNVRESQQLKFTIMPPSSHRLHRCGSNETSTLPIIVRSKRRKRLMACLTIWVIKWTITLVLLNFYWGSQMLKDLEKKSSFSLGGLVKKEFMSEDIVMKNTTKLLSSNSTFPSELREPSKSVLQTQKDERKMIVPNLSDGTLQGKQRLWKILQTRNITEVDASYWASVPTWEEIISNLYPKSQNINTSRPIIHGLETCQHFQAMTSSNPSNRRIAPAGIFNTGTNYLSVLLE